MTHEQEPHEHSFWELDQELGELELMERPDGPDRYMVRLKARADQSPYHADRELYPLTQNGIKHELWGKVYILVPEMTLSVGLYKEEQLSGAIGTVIDSQWHGMRHHEIANVRGLYYKEDRSLAIWEVDSWGRLDEFAQGRLWQFFETFLVRRFPDAQRLYTDDAEPFDPPERNREFLKALGFQHVAATERIFCKELAR